MYERERRIRRSEIVRGLDGAAEGPTPCPTDTPFFERQKKIVLENSGEIDPERIEDYIAARRLRGAGQGDHRDDAGGGDRADHRAAACAGAAAPAIPTGLKWSTVAKTGEQEKYVICNADEGDPGAFMDRSVLESDPHRVLEGMAIAGLRGGRQTGLHLRARRVSAGDQAAEDRHPPGRAPGPAGQQHLRHAVQLPRRCPAGRGRLCVRRGDGADRLHRRQARHAAAAAAVSRPKRACGAAPR